MGICLAGIAHAQSTVTVNVNPGTFVPGSTNINFTTDNVVTADVYVNIADAAGHIVRTIYAGNKSAGTYAIPWDGRDNSGVRVEDGTYTVNVSLYRLDVSQPINQFSQWGSYGSNTIAPYGIAVNGTGFVYVTEDNDSVVHVYDASGNYLTQFGTKGSGDGQLDNPLGIAVNATDFVYVVDQSNNRTEVFDRSGNYVTQFGSYGSGNGQLNEPSGVAINSTGYVYMTDPGNYRVDVFDMNGKYVANFGSKGPSGGPGNGQFWSLSGIAINATGYVYVVDDSYGQVQIFDACGDYVNKFWATSDTTYGLRNPVGIGINASGYVYVTDKYSGNNNVSIFDADGNYLAQFGHRGGAPGEFINPAGLSIVASGNVYVLDQGNGRVQAFDSSGRYLLSFGIMRDLVTGKLNWPYGVKINATGFIYVVDTGNGRIEAFSPAGSYVTQFGSSGRGYLQTPYDVAFNASGYAYVTDSGNDRVVIFDKNGNYVSEFGSHGSGAGQFDLPWGIAINSTGYVFVADTNNARVDVFDPHGSYVARYIGHLYSAEAVAINSSDYVFVTDTWPDDDNVEVFDPSGNFVTNITDGFSMPLGLSFDPSGDLFVADTNHGCIVILDRNGTELTRFTAGSTGPNMAAVDSAGRIYVAVDNNVLVYGFTSDYTVGTATVNVTSTPASGPVKNLRTGTMYQTISAAICDTDTIAGDMILVGSGTYRESVIVNKTLNLTGVDTGSGLPVVDGAGNVAINVTADSVTVQGFNATNATGPNQAAIRVTGNNATLKDNNASGNVEGIDLNGACNGTLIGNTADNNSDMGIYLENSANDTTVTHNTVNDNIFGIFVFNSGYEKLTWNTAINNSDIGIYLDNVNRTTVRNCTTDHNFFGIYMYAGDNTLTGDTANNNTGEGIYLNYGSCNNTIAVNTANYNKIGIYTYLADDNLLTGNTISNNTQYGVQLHSSNNCRLTDNTIWNNTIYGVYLGQSRNNTFWLNTVAGNGANAHIDDSMANNWNATTPVSYVRHGQTYTNYTGNYWGDYSGWDANMDGIGDTAYVINGANADTHPMFLLEAFYNGTLVSTSPIVVALYDTSFGNPETWAWDFHDGTPIVTTQNATHTFAPAASYAINLTVTRGTLTSTMTWTVVIPATSGQVKNLRTGTTYDSITAAICDTKTIAGDTILVNSGTYKENVVVNKTLNLTGVDTGTGLPVVDGSGNNTVNITADGVILQGFNVTNATHSGCAGIFICDFNNSTLTGNIADNENMGIYLYDSSNNTITDNTADNNGIGIDIVIGSNNNTVTGNTASNNTNIGIFFAASSNYNTLTGNTADNNKNYGIWINGAYNNSLTANTANNGAVGIALASWSGNNTLTRNTANNNTIGIQLLSASNNNLTANTVSSNNVGIYFYIGADNNNVTANTVSDNGGGVIITSSNGDIFWQNRFSSIVNAYVNGTSTNDWNSTTPLQYTYSGIKYTNYTGNYWSDYAGPDANADGIGDSPYAIGVNDVDYSPMLSTVSITPVVPAANFTENVTTGVAPLTAQFTDTSNGSPTGWAWNFGDFTGNVTTRNATHTFETAGVFYVTLTATNGNGSSTARQWVSVTPPSLTSYTLSLKQGWNMVSFPLVNFTIRASDLNGTGIYVVAAYNGTTGGYDMYANGVSNISYDITMRTDISYFIFCTNDTVLNVAGPSPSGRSTTINPGWNLVGWSSFYGRDAKSMCAGLPGSQVIAKYNATTGGYDMYAEGISRDSYDFLMRDGVGYYVYTNSTVPQTLYFEMA